MKNIPIAIATLLLLSTYTQCNLKVLSNTLLIDTLANLKEDPRDLKYTISHFGSIMYGMSIYGYAHFNEDNAFGCKTATVTPYNENDVQSFLVVRRGGDCDFLVKV